jgi:hypothetical protein
LLITLGLLFLYQRTRSGVTLALFSTVTALIWIVMDLVDSLYAHTIKDILFLVGVPAEIVQTVHPLSSLRISSIPPMMSSLK